MPEIPQGEYKNAVLTRDPVSNSPAPSPQEPSSTVSRQTSFALCSESCRHRLLGRHSLQSLPTGKWRWGWWWRKNYSTTGIVMRQDSQLGYQQHFGQLLYRLQLSHFLIFFVSIKLRQSTHIILAPNQPPTSDGCVYKYDFECCELSLATKGVVSRFITLKFSGTRDELTLACFGCSLVQI